MLTQHKAIRPWVVIEGGYTGHQNISLWGATPVNIDKGLPFTNAKQSSKFNCPDEFLVRTFCENTVHLRAAARLGFDIITSVTTTIIIAFPMIGLVQEPSHHEMFGPGVAFTNHNEPTGLVNYGHQPTLITGIAG